MDLKLKTAEASAKLPHPYGSFALFVYIER